MAVARIVEIAALVEERPGTIADAHRQWHAARLMGNECRQRQQIFAFRRERRRLLLRGAAGVDTSFEINDAPIACIDDRIARGDALQRKARIGVAGSARAARAADGSLPKFLPALDPEHAGIGEIVRLHRTQFGAAEADARTQL